MAETHAVMIRIVIPLRMCFSSQLANHIPLLGGRVTLGLRDFTSSAQCCSHHMLFFFGLVMVMDQGKYYSFLEKKKLCANPQIST